MSQNNYNQSRQEFEQFRNKLYQSFNYRRDTVMDLVDAIAANTTARSPVELSLSSLFSRDYSALYKGIQELNRTTQSEYRSCKEAKIVDVGSDSSHCRTQNLRRSKHRLSTQYN